MQLLTGEVSAELRNYKSIPNQVFGGPDQVLVDLHRKKGANSPGRGIDDIKVFTQKGQVMRR